MNLRHNLLSEDVLQVIIRDSLPSNRSLCAFEIDSDTNLTGSCQQILDYILSRNELVKHFLDSLIRASVKRRRLSIRPRVKIQSSDLPLPEIEATMVNKYMKIGISEMKGRRPTMEDSSTIITCFRGKPDETFLGLYDGHGGPQVSEFASKHLHETFARKLNQYEDMKRSNNITQIYSKISVRTNPVQNTASGNPKKKRTLQLSILLMSLELQALKSLYKKKKL